MFLKCLLKTDGHLYSLLPAKLSVVVKTSVMDVDAKDQSVLKKKILQH